MTVRPGHSTALSVCLVVSLALPAGQAAAQADAISVVPAEASPVYSAAFLPPDHWSTAAVRRVAALGLAPGFDPALRPHTQREVGEILERAASAEAGLPAGTARLVRAWEARYRAELALAGGATNGWRAPWRATAARWLAGTGAEAGYVRRTGAIATGWGYVDGNPAFPEWNPPTPRPDLDGVAWAAALQVAPHRDVAVRAEASEQAGKGRLEGYVAGRAAAVAFWAGRRSTAYGPGSSGIVLSPTPLDGFGLQTARAFRLPWVLRHAGDIHVGLTLSRRDLPRSFDDVTVLTTRGSVEPHPRLRLGVSRGAFFGGEGNGDVDFFDVFSVLIGKHAGDVASELDNQVVAVDVDFRPPTERWLPLRLYLEWGFEDSAGAWRNVPGVLAGIQAPAVPGLPGLSLTVERASFGRSCCGNPIWYRHSVFSDGWTHEDEPMGHDLGGHGDEWSLGGRLDLLDARLRFSGRAFSRWRGNESLYAPDREGNSTGAEAGIEWDVAGGLRARARAALEDGTGWRESAMLVGLRAFL